ncbi:MAG TPA: hypothetical protein VK980_13820 [Sphingomonas sp.]|nr:hypothetical protein [Sphingomonas sp.]
MSLMILALLQAAAEPPAAPTPPTPPAFVQSATEDGGFALTIKILPADSMSEAQDMLDAAAAKHCGTRAVVAGEQSYDQSTDSNGLPAPMITNLRMTYRCA